MAKITSKFQVTVPKRIAEHYGIEPGDEIAWEKAGDAIRIVPAKAVTGVSPATISERLRLFDRATQRQTQRERDGVKTAETKPARGWTREELYERGGSR